MNVPLIALIATAFVVAASAWPSDYRYGMTAAYEKYIQEMMSEGNVEHAPEVAGVEQGELSTVYTLPIESLDVGQTVGVVFRNPTNGWVALTLVAGNGDTVLRVAVVVNHGGAKNTLFLYAIENGIWNNAVTLNDFPFPESGKTIRMVLSVTIEEGGFAISSSGDYFTFFPYQGSLTYDKVNTILWGTGDKFAKTKSVLRQISITFPRQE